MELKKLSASEELVMAALWRVRLPAQRIDLQKALRPAHDWADSTLINFLYRLEEKGYIRREQEANHNLYTPLVRREDYAAARILELTKELCGGSLTELLDTLADAGRLNLPAMEALRDHLNTMISDSPEFGDYYDHWEL